MNKFQTNLISNCKWKLDRFIWRMKCKYATKYEISFSKLLRISPKDTIWYNGVAELVGFSKSTGLHFVIDDGNCCDFDGQWLVGVWKVDEKDIDEHWRKIFEPHGYNGEYLMKYPSEDCKKLIEEWVDFTSWKSVHELKDKIDSGKCYINVWDEDDEAYVYNRCAFCKYYRAGDRCSREDKEITINHDWVEICKQNNMHKFI